MIAGARRHALDVDLSQEEIAVGAVLVVGVVVVAVVLVAVSGCHFSRWRAAAAVSAVERGRKRSIFL